MLQETLKELKTFKIWNKFFSAYNMSKESLETLHNQRNDVNVYSIVKRACIIAVFTEFN